MRHLDIGLDLDGVCHDYVAGVRQYLSRVLGRPLESFPDPQVYSFRQLWCPDMDPEEYIDHMDAGVDAGVIFTHGEPYPGTAAAVQRLMTLGHRVHIVTARSAGSPGRAERATRQWLADHSIGFTSLTLAADKTSIKTDVFVEDYLHNVTALEQSGVECWVIDRPWNQLPEGMSDPPRRHRVASVAEAALQIADHALTDQDRAAATRYAAYYDRMTNLNRPAAREKETTRA